VFSVLLFELKTVQFSARCLEMSLEALAYTPVHFDSSKPDTGVRQQKGLPWKPRQWVNS